MTKRIVVIAVDLAVEYSRHRPLRVIHSPISLELMAGITPVGTSVPEDRERKHSGGTTTCDVACLWYATQVLASTGSVWPIAAGREINVFDSAAECERGDHG